MPMAAITSVESNCRHWHSVTADGRQLRGKSQAIGFSPIITPIFLRLTSSVKRIEAAVLVRNTSAVSKYGLTGRSPKM